MMDDGSTEEKDYLEEALCEKSVMCSVGGGIFGVSTNVESVLQAKPGKTPSVLVLHLLLLTSNRLKNLFRRNSRLNGNDSLASGEILVRAS